MAFPANFSFIRKLNTTPSMKTKTNRNKSTTSRLTGVFSLHSAALALGMMFGSAPDAAGQTYTLAQIHLPSGSFRGGASGINNHGVVVGNNSIMSGKQEVTGPGFVWANGTAISLPYLPAPLQRASLQDISDNGLIVGYGLVEGDLSASRAVWWQAAPGGGYATGDWNALLPAGSSWTLLNAWAVSDDGQFVAFSGANTVTGVRSAMVGRLDPGGLTVWTIPTIGNPPVNLSQGSAYAIHFDGNTVQVTGSCRPEGTPQTLAFRAELDVTTGATAAIVLDSRSSSGRSINGSGTAVGTTNSSSACVWNVDGTTVPLPTLGGAANSAADINDNGFVVGRSTRSGRNSLEHAFLWHPTTGMRDLNSLKSPSDTSGIELMAAFRINASGQIIARGVIKNRYQDVVMTPAP